MSAGRVITFYSYKGGVGRTFTLANTAVLLAKWGYRVLCVDFDLEAPGLPRYFRRDTPHAGLMDLIGGVLAGAPLPWRSVAQPIDFHEDLGDRLTLLGAGREDQRYASELQKLSWDHLYAECGFGAVLESWRAEWVEAFDFVLVDSRTGYTDIQGICTAQLPDVLVALFTCNDQSLDGMLRVIDRARQVRDRLPVDRAWLPVLPIPSRYDAGEFPEEGRKWLNVFRNRLAYLYDDWCHEDATPERLLDVLRVNYKARWTFGEEVPALVEREMDPANITYGIATVAAFLARGLTGSDQLVAGRDGYVKATIATRQSRLRPGAGTFEFDFLVSRPATSPYADAVVAEVERRGFTCTSPQRDLSAGGDWLRGLGDLQQRARHLLWIASDSPSQQAELFSFLVTIEGAADRSCIRVGEDELPPMPRTRSISGRLPALVADEVVAALGRAPAAEPRRPAPAGNPYRAWLRKQHAHVIPFFPGAGDRLLAQIYVEVEVAPEARSEGMERAASGRMRPEHGLGGSTTLDKLLGRTDIDPHRWVILGEPGAGKTTLLRHLARTLAEREAGPVPIFLSLALHAHARPDPIEAAVAEAGADARETLSAVARSGDLWILLDGLDEVAPELQEPTRAWIEALHERYPSARIVVASRPIAVSQVGLRNHFNYLRVRPLSEAQQKELLTRLLGADEAVAVAAELRARPTLGSMATSPLLLTMIAMVGREAGALGGALPAHRKQLYEQVIDLLLRRGHCPEPRGVKDRRTAREVLKHLSLRLHQSGGETWTPAALDVELWAVRTNPALNLRLKETWGSNDAFLNDVGHNSGVLGPHDGPQEPWRYLHRSQREFLAAEALAEDAEALKRVLALLQVKDHGERFKNASRWGEVLLLACNLVPDPLVALTAIRDADADLALRAVGDVPTLAPEKSLDFLFNTAGWDGEHLLALARLWREPPVAVTERLWALVAPGGESYRLGCLWYVLEHFGAPFDRFREQAKLREAINLQYVPVPGGTFSMGSPPEIGYAPEHPQHTVTLSPFEMTATPITNAEFKSLFPGHQPHIFGKKPDAEGRHPVNTVSWYEAHLFAACAGARLPTEAQWEYACRAGTTTRWFHGDEEAGLEEYAWYNKNSDGKTHTIAQKKANVFGLFDMHGQVWEWCHDWFGAYPSAPQTEPLGAPRGGRRVVRGGSYWSDADVCRAACRNGVPPGDRSRNLGFRLVRPAPLRA